MIISAVIVTFNPDLLVLNRVIESLSSQVNKVLIIDNGSSVEFHDFDHMYDELLTVVMLKKNMGIGYAQNIGIKEAIKKNYDFVLLMDQDSVPDKEMCKALLDTYNELSVLGYEKISIIGPTTIDSTNKSPHPHSRLRWFGMQRNPCSKNDKAVISDNLIASGSLIKITTLVNVGLMDEKLFIDRVDTEWLLRAKSMGYKSWGSCNAFLIHSLGEHRMKIWLFHQRNIAFHKPFRYYYIYRNSILLIKRRYIPFSWKIDESLRLLKIFFFMIFFHKERFIVFKMVSRGVFHGFLGRTG